ncbi:DUF262 domain-containing protein [Limnothrix sp. FACHB-1083]|uniref:DUF262 domain-containing protein n=1 Tax=unclassified Limnothrix TaxID=2632864 RepID=UPI0016813EE3|nr:MULTISPECIES: DUF262 domain-containing protein [unclassified Limnothrix]MBD2159790.1 DUF262 domain-containing protein [Limnothrix sp. FACHB-1083]MBD2190492.1 DUF262 domain-containing protein [Limnothrix sp. FACHB-1088]
MAPIHLLDTRTASFGDLLGNGKRYQVPLFQRDYSWTEENWEDLWQDILGLHQNPKTSHYMGAIVLQNSRESDKEFTIIDGQQRLATLSIIAIVVINKIKTLASQGNKPEENQERQEILKRTYLSDKDSISLRYSSKIRLNGNNNGFYQDYLINLKQPRNIRSLPKSNQLIWQAFEYFSKQIDQHSEIVKSGENLAEFLTDIIARRLLFIQISVEDELNAYTVFETLNARGLELSSTDLLKNYLFSLIRSSGDLKALQRQWQMIINTVRMEKFPEFLRYYLSLEQPWVRRERLFKIVRESVKNGHQVFDLIDQLESYSSLFVALGNAQDDFWRETPANRAYIRELELFRVKQAYSILFAAHGKFSDVDFTRLLKLISVLSFRYTVVCGLNPSELEKVYNQVAIAIQSSEITTPKQVFEKLRSIYVSDEKFAQDFELLTVATRGQQKKLARYILWKLENDAANQEIVEESFSIEHILPESPEQDWLDDFTDAQITDMVYRLGNLTPLEPPLNRQIGNQSYTTKRDVYPTSAYRLTQEILAEEWTPNALANRQKQLAKRAVHIWRSDFAT